jgi:alkyldihydroxyacetonephosphate synthase
MSQVSNSLLHERLRSIVGEDNIVEAEQEGTAHSMNCNWYTRQMWMDDKDIPIPAVGVYPQTTGQVSDILTLAQKESIPVTPFGMGSSAMGGNVPEYGGILVDLKRMNDIKQVNEESHFATVQPGVGNWEYEDRLNELGYTSGHLPASHYSASVGGMLALRSAGRLSTAYGKIEDMILGLTVVLPDGSVVETKPVPAHAAGPDIDQLFVGSEGAFGIITEATLEIHPYPKERKFRAILFEDFESGFDAMRDIVQTGLTPALARLYTEEETARTFKETWGLEREGAYAILSWDGPEAVVNAKRDEALEICEQAGGEDMGAERGEEWWNNRYADYYPDEDSVQNYKALRGGHQNGTGGTVTTSVSYDQAEEAYEEMKIAFKDQFADDYEAWIHAHFSHWYNSGTMFYCRWHLRDIPDDQDMFKLYNKVWSTLVPVSLKYDGVVDHHHGTGRLLGRFLREQDEGSHDLLEDIKKSVDPENIMNPGVMGLEGR